MARSSPGQCTPAPSPTQKTPKLVNMTPTSVLMVFSGTSLSWRATSEADDAHEDGRRGRGQRGQAEPVLGGAEADHDQHHLGALEEDALEGHREADAVAPARPVPAATPPLALRAELGHRLGEDLVLVVQVLVAAGAQDRLAQPRQAEHQQQRAHHHPERVDRDVADERDAHGQHQHPQDHDRRRRALQGRAPAPAHAGGHDDGQGLDHLHQAGGEDGQDQHERGRGVHPGCRNYRQRVPPPARGRRR